MFEESGVGVWVVGDAFCRERPTVLFSDREVELLGRLTLTHEGLVSAERRWGRFVFGQEQFRFGRGMIGENEGMDFEVGFEENVAEGGDGLGVRDVGGLEMNEIRCISLRRIRTLVTESIEEASCSQDCWE